MEQKTYKIGVIADSHGKTYMLDKILRQMGEVDCYMHLGDFVRDAQYLQSKVQFPVYFVKGNCDFSTIVDIDLQLTIAQRKIWLNHGHPYHVKYGLHMLISAAREKQVDIVLFGHTHAPCFEQHHNIYFINPGSVGEPRLGSSASALVLHIGTDFIFPQYIYPDTN